MNQTLKQPLLGIIITLLIYGIAMLGGHYITPSLAFFSPTFGTHTLMLLLSMGVILCYKPSVDYHISWPEFKKIGRPILFGILTCFGVSFIMNLITHFFGGEIQSMKLLGQLSPWQTFVFVFLYASVAEEFLFRGFLQNVLKPLKEKHITVLRRKISYPVLISGAMFGLAHLILLTSGQDAWFILRIVLFTSTLGIFAGYYQEKYNNHIYAIITHMSGNFLALVSAIIVPLLNLPS